MGIDFKEERVEELKLFGLGLFGINGAPEMMPEIVKEAAKRFAWRSEQSQVSEPLAIARGPGIPGIVKVRIVIQKSWAPSESFDVDGIHLEELIKMAEAVGAEFKITEVQDFSFCLDSSQLCCCPHSSTGGQFVQAGVKLFQYL